MDNSSENPQNQERPITKTLVHLSDVPAEQIIPLASNALVSNKQNELSYAILSPQTQSVRFRLNKVASVDDYVFVQSKPVLGDDGQPFDEER